MAPKAPDFPALLLLYVRPPDRGRRRRAADDAGDGDEREDVRERLHEGSDAAPDAADAELERRREAEEERGREGSERAPVPEDERGEADKAAAGRDVLRERVRVAD